MYNEPSVPARCLQVVVEPAQQDLVRSQPQEVVNRLALFTQTVQFRVNLDIHLRQQTSPDDLPNETQDQVLSSFNDIGGADVDDGAADSFGGRDDNVVVLGHLESIEGLARRGFVQDTRVNRLGYGVVDQFAKDETIASFVKQLHGVRWNGEASADVRIFCKNLTVKVRIAFDIL